MKMRTVNQITGAACVLANAVGLIAVLTGMHTTFGVVAVSISLAVSLGMYLRVVVGTAALKVAEQQEKLIYIAVAQKNDPAVVNEYAEWVLKGDMEFMGARICNLVEAVDENGNRAGYWILMVGTPKICDNIRHNLKTGTVLDYWPIDWENAAKQIVTDYLGDQETIEPDDDAIPELKG